MTELEETVLLLIANVGEGDARGHKQMNHDKWIELTTMSGPEIREALGGLKDQGLADFVPLQGKRPQAWLKPWGRQAAHELGAVIPSPIEDANTLDAFLSDPDAGDQRRRLEFAELAMQLGWSGPRLRDAWCMLEPRG